jgi:NADH:ubiquinone oxidoreductase subunit 3 (subunit A)
MAPGWGTVAIFMLVGLAFLGITLLVGRAFRPHRPDAVKLGTYECGPVPFEDAWHQFNPRYYLFALLFVLFDVETVFLYPWALAFRAIGLLAVFEMVIFVAIVAVGLVYAWRTGALEWQ